MRVKTSWISGVASAGVAGSVEWIMTGGTSGWVPLVAGLAGAMSAPFFVRVFRDMSIPVLRRRCRVRRLYRRLKRGKLLRLDLSEEWDVYDLSCVAACLQSLPKNYEDEEALWWRKALIGSYLPMNVEPIKVTDKLPPSTWFPVVHAIARNNGVNLSPFFDAILHYSDHWNAERLTKPPGDG